MPIAQPDDDEIVETIKRSYLPTIFVEGTDDANIFRVIEEKVSITFASIFPCFGRDTLLKVYRRKSEFQHKSVAWIADRDMWIFSSPDPDLRDVVFTTGYSIENDVYAGSNAEILLESDERLQHKQLIGIVCHWFALETQEYFSNREHRVNVHNDRVIDYDNMCIKSDYAALRNYQNLDPALLSSINSNYQLFLRGKNLLFALERFLNASGRRTRFNRATIIDACLRLTTHNQYLDRIANEVKMKLAIAQGFTQ